MVHNLSQQCWLFLPCLVIVPTAYDVNFFPRWHSQEVFFPGDDVKTADTYRTYVAAMRIVAEEQAEEAEKERAIDDDDREV